MQSSTGASKNPLPPCAGDALKNAREPCFKCSANKYIQNKQNDIGSYTDQNISSADMCANKCNEVEGCESFAYVYNIKNNNAVTCNLYSTTDIDQKITAPSQNYETTLGIPCPPGTQTAHAQPSAGATGECSEDSLQKNGNCFTCTTKTNLPNAEKMLIPNKPNITSADMCAKKCDELNDCKSFYYDSSHKPNICTLYSTTDTIQKNPPLNYEVTIGTPCKST